MEKHVDIFGIMILKSIYDFFILFFYEALLVIFNIQTSEFHKSRQCHEWIFQVRQHSECS